MYLSMVCLRMGGTLGHLSSKCSIREGILASMLIHFVLAIVEKSLRKAHKRDRNLTLNFGP